MGLTALLYNWGYFTVLGFAPFPMHLGTHQLGIAFTVWGVLVAIFAVFAAPRLQARFGLARTLYVNLALFAADIAVIGLCTHDQAVLIVAVVATGIFIGVNNTITTQAVMTVAPVERSAAAASYGFVRFIGGGLAPYAAGKMAEHWGAHVPFYVGATSVLVAVAVLATGHRLLRIAEHNQTHELAGTAGESDAAGTGALARGTGLGHVTWATAGRLALPSAPPGARRRSSSPGRQSRSIRRAA